MLGARFHRRLHIGRRTIGADHRPGGDPTVQRRRGKGGARGRRWHVDETYLKVGGRWAYLYRAVDRDGNLVDTMLSEHRDMAAAQAFFRSAKAVTGVTPDQVTTDGHGSYPRAIRSTLGRDVEHRTSAYKNNGAVRLGWGVATADRMSNYASARSSSAFPVKPVRSIARCQPR